MVFEYSTVYNFQKFYMLGILTAGVIITSIIIVFTYCSNLGKNKKTALNILNVTVLGIHTAAFLLIVSPPREFMLFAKIYLIFLFLLGPVFFIFACFSLETTRKFTLKKAWPGILPFFCMLVIVLSSYSRLFFTVEDLFYLKFQNLYYIYLFGYNYPLALVGLYLLIKQNLKKQQRIGNFQLIPYLLGSILIVGIDMIYFLNAYPYPLTPVSIAIVQAVFLTLALSKGFNSFLKNRQMVIDTIKDSIIMTDIKGTIVYYNETDFNSLFEVNKGITIEEVNGRFLENTRVDFFNKPDDFTFEFTLHKPIRKDYSFNKCPIIKKKGEVVGFLYIFRDITIYKYLLEEMELKNSQLLMIHEELNKYSRAAGFLAEEQERNNIVQYIHKTISLYIQEIIKNLEDMKNQDFNEKNNKAKVYNTIELARKGILKVRESVNILSETSITKEKIND